MTGALQVTGTGLTSTLELREGKLVGSINAGRARKIGQMLVNRGIVDRAAIDEAFAYQQDFSNGTPFGKILVQRNHITDDQLRQALRLQLDEELWDIFSLKEGNYKFEHGSAESVGRDLLIELEVEPLILEGTRKVDEWSRISKNITNLLAVPVVVGFSDPSDRELMHLNPQEWNVLSLVNGYSDLGCIAGRSGLGRFETFRIINSFLANGLVELKNVNLQPGDNVEIFDSRDADAAKKAKAKTSESQQHGEQSSTALASLMARFRESEARPTDTPATGRLTFASPASFVAALCNRILEDLMKNPDFIVNPDDARLAERFWRKVLMDCPRADLVTAEQNILNAGIFDRYLEPGGVEGPLKPIYLETMEALNRFLRVLYQLATLRLGSRTARHLFVNILDDYRKRSTIGQSDLFFFNEFAGRALE